MMTVVVVVVNLRVSPRESLRNQPKQRCGSPFRFVPTRDFISVSAFVASCALQCGKWVGKVKLVAAHRRE